MPLSRVEKVLILSADSLIPNPPVLEFAGLDHPLGVIVEQSRSQVRFYPVDLRYPCQSIDGNPVCFHLKPAYRPVSGHIPDPGAKAFDYLLLAGKVCIRIEKEIDFGWEG